MKNRNNKNKKFTGGKLLKGTKDRPRLSVFRSGRYLYAQIIDDTKGQTLLSVTEKELKTAKSEKLTKIQKAELLGKLLAQKADKLKIKKVIFDRNGFRYHGRVKSFAQVCRSAGLSI